MIPDWQLPPGVDRGLWDYLRSGEMVAGYDAQMRASPLAAADVAACEAAFPTPGKLVDLGCGTGRLAIHFALRGYDCTGVDLSEEMLSRARENAANAGANVVWTAANLVDLAGMADASFDYAACLFSTLGMVRGAENRLAAAKSAARILKPGGRFVLHAHHRGFRGLGLRMRFVQAWRSLIGSASAGDVTMPQAYGGAPLTLHHFSRSELVALLDAAGFDVREVRSITETGDTALSPGRTYGYLAIAEKRGS